MGKGTKGEEYGIGHQQSNLNLIRIHFENSHKLFNFLKIYRKLNKQVFNWLAPIQFYSWPKILNAVTIPKPDSARWSLKNWKSDNFIVTIACLGQQLHCYEAYGWEGDEMSSMIQRISHMKTHRQRSRKGAFNQQHHLDWSQLISNLQWRFV